MVIMKAQNDFVDILKFTHGPKLAEAFLKLRDSQNKSDNEDKNMVMYHTKKNLKRKNKRLAVVYVRMDAGFLDLIKIMRDFYQYKTRNELFPYLFILAVLDIANLPKNPKWTKSQLKAWQESKKMALDFKKTLALMAAKDVLAEQPDNTKLSVEKLARLSRKKIRELKNAKR